MNNTAIIVKINNIEKHPNADKLQLVRLFGTQVITGLDTKLNDLMIYFDSNLRLSKEYLSNNNLYRHSELNVDTTQIGYFDDSGKVKAIKLRGEFSDGMLMPLSSLSFTGTLKSDLIQGFEFNDYNNLKICEKYVVIKNINTQGKQKNKTQKKVLEIPMFVQHLDTEQFFKNQHKIPANTICYIMEKTHGTSGRIGNVLVDVTPERHWFKRLLLKIIGIRSYQYKYIHGSRRVVLNGSQDNKHAYHDRTIREVVMKQVQGMLDKGMQIYFEIYGHEPSGKEIQKGFSYGCAPRSFDVKLYRVTMNNEDGKVVDYSLDYVINKANELGFKAPHVFSRFFYDGSEESMKQLEKEVIHYAQGQSVMDKNTLREGVIVQFINANGNWDYLKYKSDAFRALESSNYDKNITDQEDVN